MAMSNAEKLKLWRSKNPDKVRAQKQRYHEKHPTAAKEYRERTKDRAAETRLIWQRLNADKIRKWCRNWRENNPDKNTVKAIRYRANKKMRYAKWDRELTDFVTQEAAHLCSLRKMLFGFDWHIDHVVPMCGDTVSGLHVWNNLAVIPARENIRKSNRVLNDQIEI